MASKIKLTQHFPVPVFSSMLEGFGEHQQALISLILSQRETTPGLVRSNQNAWHSENNFHLTPGETIQWLNNNIGEFSRACLVNIDKQIAKADIALTSSWAVVGGYGAWNAPHNHFPSQWSGVLYVSVDDCVDSANPESKNGKIEFLNPSPLSHAYGQPNGVAYLPKNGLILLFPAVLEHLVHPNLTENLRIAISFNLNIIYK